MIVDTTVLMTLDNDSVNAPRTDSLFDVNYFCRHSLSSLTKKWDLSAPL